jgi:hypothetical protein
MVVRGEPFDGDLEAGALQRCRRCLAGEVVGMVDLDRTLEGADAAGHAHVVERVDERVAVVCRQPMHGRERRRRIEQVVDRLAEQHEVPATPVVEVLREAGNRLHPGFRRDCELVRRGVEHGRRGTERVAHRPGDYARRAAEIEHRRR